MTIALEYASRSLQLAKNNQLKQQISDAHQRLSAIFEKKGDANLSLEHYKHHIAYRDSVNNVATVQNMADLRTDFEVNLREKEIDLLEERDQLNSMYLIIGVMLLVLSVVLLLCFRKRFHHTRLLSLTERKQHSEKIKGLMKSFETKALESMVQGKEDERKRLALELNNHFGSFLATIKVNLNGIDDQSSSHHQTINTLVDQACTDIRSMSHKLNMGVSENFGLVPALKELTDQLHQSGEIKVEFKASVCDDHLDSKCEIVIYRIVQELVSNVLKHANATKLSVLLTCFEEEELINIIVQDNGKGIVKKRKRKDSTGIGLASLEKMVASQQGELNIDSNPESGTTISIDLPLVKAPELTEVIKKTKIVSGG